MINIGDTIDNRYNILEHLGTGGMADVFEAKDLISNKIVAIKILKEELKDDKNNISSFRKEASSAASMSHPNIMEIYNEGTFKGCPYLVIEYLKNQTLLDKIEYFTKFAPKEGSQIMVQLLEAIAYTHSHNIIHRDIKPQNIFYMPNGTIKLGDFGIAVNENDAKKCGNILGSVYYLAPEVYGGKSYSIESDIYAAGVTFFHILTGRTPFDGTTEEIANAHIKNDFPKPSSVNLLIPKEIDQIILKATKKNPAARYHSAKEFQTDILNFLNGVKVKKSFLDRIFK
ncbi:MAG: serine/threonine protein kinase [Firmicutes bacterium]|nr:serine/threonine protein kinase [Candidatus Fiminaster equi]